MTLHLSRREVEVCVLAGCVTAPMTAKAIGKELGISKRTVEAHIVSGSRRIQGAYPGINGSPRRVCQAWVRLSYYLAPRVNAEIKRRAA